MDDNYVLLVEDNDAEVLLTRLAFKQAKVSNNVVVASDGQQALDFLFSHGSYANRNKEDKPGVVLLDLKLPLVGGIEVLREIKADKNTADIPVAILTSSSQIADRSEAYRLGANDYFQKPMDFTKFVELIKQIKARYLDTQVALK